MNRTQRARINRENAQKSTGPKTEEGKNRSRLNALKHGLRAEAITLPTEDAAVLQAHLEEWEECYGPETPGERALVERAAFATVQMHRCARFQVAAVAKQVRSAARQWDDLRGADVARQVALLKDDPAAAVRGLKATAEGCTWLIDQWDDLRAKMVHFGCHLSHSERDLAQRMLGRKPEEFRTDAEVYWFRVVNLCALEAPNAEALDWLLDTRQMPESMRRIMAIGHPGVEDARDELTTIVATQLAELRARADRLRAEIDGPDRAEAADRALLLDGPAGSLLLRYERSHESAFHRAYKAILQAQKEADAHNEDEAPPVDGSPSVSPTEPAVATAPNEANVPKKKQSITCYGKTWDSVADFIAGSAAESTSTFEVVPPDPDGTIPGI